MEPLHNLSFLIMEFRLSQSLSQTFFYTMGFWLSQSLSRTFLSHDGSLAIMEPFANFSFTRLDFRLSRSLSQTFLSHDWILAITEPFANFSHGGTHKAHDLGEYSFHIYYKEYLHRIRLVKNLAT
jgi:hypothetical protein